MSERGNPSMASMTWSVLVLGAIVLALYGLGQLIYGYEPEPHSVDYSDSLAEARRVAEFEVLAPRALPEGWRANHVTFTAEGGGAWRLGVLTEDEDYIGLEQTPLSVPAALERYAPDSRPAGGARVAGHSWEVHERAADGETTFVRTEENHTILVTGSAPRAVIEAYIDSLVTE